MIPDIRDAAANKRAEMVTEFLQGKPEFGDAIISTAVNLFPFFVGFWLETRAEMPEGISRPLAAHFSSEGAYALAWVTTALQEGVTWDEFERILTAQHEAAHADGLPCPDAGDTLAEVMRQKLAPQAGASVVAFKGGAE
jgi:hypothetical protein